MAPIVCCPTGKSTAVSYWPWDSASTLLFPATGLAGTWGSRLTRFEDYYSTYSMITRVGTYDAGAYGRRYARIGSTSFLGLASKSNTYLSDLGIPWRAFGTESYFNSGDLKFYAITTHAPSSYQTSLHLYESTNQVNYTFVSTLLTPPSMMYQCYAPAIVKYVNGGNKFKVFASYYDNGLGGRRIYESAESSDGRNFGTFAINSALTTETSGGMMHFGFSIVQNGIGPYVYMMWYQKSEDLTKVYYRGRDSMTTGSWSAEASIAGPAVDLFPPNTAAYLNLASVFVDPSTYYT